MLSFDEALERILGAVEPLEHERVPLHQAGGRVLAEALCAPGPLPPHDYSAMDGYAVRLGDFTGQAPFTLPVRGESRTGRSPDPLPSGATSRIFTGAVIPKGANAVVMQENVERSEDTATFNELPRLGANIRRAGEDLEAGAEALATGRRLDPFAISLAAALDQGTLPVHRRPRVAVLSTGDELRPPGSPNRPGSIPESNGPMIAALAAQAGADVTVLPKIDDDPAALDDALGSALRDHDLLVTIGGVSVGDHDEVKPALERAGVTLDFWKVRIRPGKPLVFGTREGTRVLGLPGNPVSAGITFLLFGMPLIRRLGGECDPKAPRQRFALTAPLKQKPGRLGFYRGVLEGNAVRPLANQSSGSTVSLAWADCLIVVPADSEGFAAGDTVEILRLKDL